MPGEMRLTKTKMYFFAHPKQASASVGGVFGLATLIVLLIPTCIKLTPLGNAKKDAKGERDDASDKYDSTLQQYNKAQADIVEAKQRVIDLNCAIPGYQQFNYYAIAFQKSLNDPQKSTLARLNSWQIYFAPDSTNTDQSSITKTYYQDEWVYEYYYSCTDHYCGVDSHNTTISCCSDWGNHLVTYAYDYIETTTITNLRKNIIQGTPLSLSPLNCGYYSRTFETFAPETYQTYESSKVNSGDRSTGHTAVSFRREYGSRISARYRLDDNTINKQLIVLRETTQADAATDLAQNLYKFLTVAVAAFNATGIDYPALQQRINNSIPLLTDKAATIYTQLQDDAGVLAGKEEIYGHADDEFHDGLKLWLPMFFLIPMGFTLFAALLTYFITTHYRNRNNRQQEVTPEITPNDGELAVVVPPAPELQVTQPPVFVHIQEEPPALYDEASAPRI
ncbi:MAG: hypothetical protein P4L65_05210 [Legionella sp.]|nr:hypothetical protein [Legionella sp.]